LAPLRWKVTVLMLLATPRAARSFGGDDTVAVQVGDDGGGVVVDAVVVEVGDDGDGDGGVDVLSGDRGADDPGVPDLGLLGGAVVMPVRLNRWARWVPGPEKPGRVLFVVEVRTTSPGSRSSVPVEKVPGNGAMLLWAAGPVSWSPVKPEAVRPSGPVAG